MSDASTLARPLDDARHSLLSKARPVSQTSIGAFLEHEGTRRDQPLLPRDTWGTYEVRELDVKGALTNLGLPGPPTWSLNPYMGCSHDCTYCYVPDVAHLERENYGSYVLVKRNLPRVLSRELKTKPERPVFLSSATDPYQPAEAHHHITRRCLELLRRSGWPVRVLTRSPLVRRDLTLLRELDDVGIGLSVPTIDDAVRKVVEPGAPPVEGRLRTLEALADAGLEPFANLAPAYPLTGGVRPDDVAEAFRATGVAQVYFGRWKYLAGVLPALSERLDGTRYEELVRAVQDEAYYDRLAASLRGAFRRAGVPFHEMTW